MRLFRYAGFLAVLLLSGTAQSQQTPPAKWDPNAAAAWLDQRASWWMDWPKASRDHETFCVSCHTLAPFALSRPMLRSALSETGPSPNERRMLENITRRVRMWGELEPFYSDQTSGLPKTSESRGTEAILNALILVWRDRQANELSADARLALDNMWGLQLRSGEMNGAWAWLQFHNAPWEGDSQFYGVALGAIAVGSAPGKYRIEPGVQAGIERMESWLRKQMVAQTPLDRVTLLWAAARLPELLTTEQKNAIVSETLARQREDGGFSMASLIGDWKRRDNTPLDFGSDGYATGLVAFVLQQVDVQRSDPRLRRALDWLAANQIPGAGRWAAASLNKHRELSSDAGYFMSDAATAYAAMALASAH